MMSAMLMMILKGMFGYIDIDRSLFGTAHGTCLNAMRRASDPCLCALFVCLLFVHEFGLPGSLAL